MPSDYIPAPRERLLRPPAPPILAQFYLQAQTATPGSWTWGPLWSWCSCGHFGSSSPCTCCAGPFPLFSLYPLASRPPQPCLSRPTPPCAAPPFRGSRTFLLALDHSSHPYLLIYHCDLLAQKATPAPAVSVHACCNPCWTWPCVTAFATSSLRRPPPHLFPHADAVPPPAARPRPWKIRA